MSAGCCLAAGTSTSQPPHTMRSDRRESGRFGKKDFYRMDNYVLRLRPEAARKLLDALRIRLNCPVRHRGKLYSWDIVSRMKAQQLANYILGRRNSLNFGDPRPSLDREHSEAVRNLILSLTTAEARRRGIGKSTLWYLQERARMTGPMRVYKKVKARLPRDVRQSVYDDPQYM